jgi:hypothetical protein
MTLLRAFNEDCMTANFLFLQVHKSVWTTADLKRADRKPLRLQTG